MLEVNRVRLEISEHINGGVVQARLGIPHGSGRIPVDRSEIALAGYERIAHAERLREVNQGGVHDGFPMRVVIPRGVTSDLGTLSIAARWAKVEVIHRHEDAPLRWL